MVLVTNVKDVETDDRAIHYISGNLKDVDQNSDKMDISQDSISKQHDGKYQQEEVTLIEDGTMVHTEDKENVLPIGPGGDNVEDSQNFQEDAFREGLLEHPVEKKLRIEGHHSDAMSTGSQDSVKGGKTSSDCPSSTSSKPNSSEGTGKSPTHKLDSKEKAEKDALRKERDREREERTRQQREKLAQERQQKIDEMREQQKAAQEKREKQLEARRMKIDELRRREEERRKEVEERRRKQDEEDRARKEAIIMKSKERITRYEQWKAHTTTRKGGISYVIGFGSRAPREVCQPLERRRSSSHSTLFRRSPHGSDSDSYRPHRRAFSACSVRRHCCIDINKLTGQGMLSYCTNRLSVSHIRDLTSLCADCTALVQDCRKFGYFSPQIFQSRRKVFSSDEELENISKLCSPDLRQHHTPRDRFWKTDINGTPVQSKGSTQRMLKFRRKLNFTDCVPGSMTTIEEEKVM